jgi:putative DNA primase/helicase
MSDDENIAQLHIKVDKKRYNELLEKYPSAKGIIISKVDNYEEYFNKKPFKSKYRDVWIDEIKENITFENLHYEEEQKIIREEEKKKSLLIMKNKLYQAEEFIKINPFFYDKNKLWWIWNEKKFRYENIDEVDLLNKFKGEEYNNEIINSTERNEIINSFKQIGRLNIPEEPSQNWIQFKDKIINIETDEEILATPKYFITNPIDWKIGEKEDTPAIDILFSSWVNEEHQQELYEILAFCMLPNYFIHRMFCLIGSGANGKSTFLKILQRFIGVENITSSSLNMLMNERFEGSKLYKKLVCLMGETTFNLITNTDFLKKLTGEDLVRAEFKGKNPFDFLNYSKLIMATNSLPPTADKTEGFYRRWKIIKFPNKFDKEIDILHNILDEEYENLTKKCYNILKQLWKDRLFTNDGSFDERKQIYENESNPLMKFIKENYKKELNGEVLFQEFYEGFSSYLEERGHRLLSAIATSKQLKVEGFEIKTLSRNNINGRFIIGLNNKN